MDAAPLALTVGVYAVATRLRTIPPILTTSIVLAVVLPLVHISPDAYARGTAPLVALLGPAIVALAVPLVREAAAVRRSAHVIGAAVIVGTLTSIVATIVAGRLFGLPSGIIAALAPRNATAPVAAAVAAQLGADPQLAAAASVAGALLFALGAGAVLRAGDRTGGLALGIVAHGIGTARAAHIDARAGAFASVAMALSAIAVAGLAPLVLAALR